MNPARANVMRAAALALACLLAPGPARAASTYQLVFDRSLYQIDPGATVDVSVYLEEDTGGVGNPSVLASDGLTGAGARVSFDLAPLPGDPAGILADSNIAPNPAFDGLFQSATVAPGSHADLTETVDLSTPPVLATDLGGGVYRIWIGTFTFTAGMTTGETTTIRASDIPSPSDDFITGLGDTLDPSIGSSTASILVQGAAAVPEPSGVVMVLIAVLGAGGYGLARWAWRRRADRPRDCTDPWSGLLT